MLGLYAAKAAEDIAASERLIADALERREQALMILSRASELSNDLARFLDAQPYESDGIDIEIDW